MAENLRELTEIEKIKERIAHADERIAHYAKLSSSYSKRKLKDYQAEKKEQQALLKEEQKRVNEQKKLQKEQSAFAKSFAKLSPAVKKLLADQNSETSIYHSINQDIIQSKVKQTKLTGEELQAEIERENYLTQISNDMLQQAQATAKAEADAKGLNEFEQKRLKIKENVLGLSEAQIKRDMDAVNLEEQMYLKEQKLKQIRESQQDMFNALPDSLKGAVGFAQKLGNAIKTASAKAIVFTLLAGILIAGITAFKDLDDAAGEFRETTGLTNSQMEGIRSNASEIAGEFGDLGVTAKGAFDTVAALKSEFSDIYNVSKETTAALTVMNQNFGIAAADSGKVQGIFEQIGGLSSETAANVQMQAANMAKLAGVAPAKVFKDIAENAEVASTLFKGDLTKLTKNAIEARRLGTNLKDVAATAEKLLDFEGSIEDELVAATYVGGQFNLSRARALAMEGNIVDAQKETLAQLQRSGDFRKQDYFTQRQLAKAAGMSVEEINKQLDAQDKLNSLTSEQRKQAEEAINAGLDITNISADQLASETQKFKVQQENQKSLDKLANTFTSIAATVGNALTPLLDALIPIIQAILYPVQLIGQAVSYIIQGFTAMAPVLLPILAIFNAMWIKTQALAIMSVIKGAWTSLGGLPVVGPALAIAAIAGGIGFIKSQQKAGDMYSPADGKTQVSTKEGGLFELSPNDDLIAAPGAAKAMNGGSGGNLAVLSAPLNTMIGELKALRADLAAGKIAVRMDGAKVSAGIGTVVEGSTRNNYAMAQG
jgi:hypothetical protein